MCGFFVNLLKCAYYYTEHLQKMNDEIFLYRSLKYKKKDLNQHHSPHNVLKNVKVVQKTIFGKNFLHSGQPHFKNFFFKKSWF